MAATSHSQPLLVRGPDSLPVLVPHLVGFHPRESLVVLGLDPRERTVRVTVRVDLPHVTAEIEEVIKSWASLLTALIAAGALEVIMVVYPGESENPWHEGRSWDLPRRSLLAGLVEALSGSGLITLDAICVVGDRLRSYWCEDPACCPRQGRVVEEAEALRVGAHLVALGSAPLPSRESLAAALTPRPDDDPFAQRVATAREGVIMRLPAGTAPRVGAFVHGLRTLSPEPRNLATLTRLVVIGEFLAVPVRSRDLLLHALTVDGDGHVLLAARRVLGEAVRCGRRESVPAVASVLAVCCWVDGDGAAARVALERASAVDPEYSLATLVSSALDAGIPPWTWISLMADLCVSDILGDEINISPQAPPS